MNDATNAVHVTVRVPERRRSPVGLGTRLRNSVGSRAFLGAAVSICAEEQTIGPAFAILTEDLVKTERSRLVAQLRTWIASDDVHQRYFAAEIVGFHRLHELQRTVLRAAEGKDPLQTWESWELNCLWAADQIDGQRNQRLIDFLARTDKYENQAWILKAFDQLVEAD